MQPIIAYLFQINSPTPLKYAWVTLTLLNAALALWLAWRTWPSSFSMYMPVSALSSIFRASPLWPVGADFALAAAACLFGWSLLPKDAMRWFALAVGAMLVGTLMWSAPIDWPGYPPLRYHTRLHAAVGLLAVSLTCVLERWARGERQDWRTVIAAVWFAVWFLTLVQWRTDVETQAYWAQYWRIALAGKIAAGACLCGWLIQSRPNLPKLVSDLA